MTATAIKERPILFSGLMVRAILAGKTQTRRAVRRQPSAATSHWWTTVCSTERGDIGGFVPRDGDTIDAKQTGEAVHCPYGRPGDRLWVRETWMPLWDSGAGFLTCLCPTGHEATPDVYKYRADGEAPHNFAAKWRPSIHMPRRASRLTLEITDVRVERLQSMSDADALAEGVTKIRDACYVIKGFDYDNAGLCHTSPITPLAKLWDVINGPEAWNANPWVWVVTFKRLEQST